MAEDKGQESVYNTKSLSKWFAITSIILLIAVVWGVIEDYDRPWKGVVRQYNRVQTAIGTARLSVAKQALEKSKSAERLKELEEQLELVQKAQDKVLGEIDAKIKKLEDVYYLSNNKFQLLNAKHSADLFTLETAIKKESPKVPRLKKEFEEQALEVDRLKVLALADENKVIKAKEMRVDILSREKELLAEKSKIEKDIVSTKKLIAEFDASLANILRNAPVVDFMVPTIKINQVILPHLKDDYFFNKVARVDRCMTCHATIDQPGFEDFPQPFKTHSKLALMVGPDSAHPMASMGCTTCHGGVPQSVDFIDAAHTPRSKAQEQEWAEKYDFHANHHIKTHMLPVQLTEGKCIQCHSEQVNLEGAPTFNAGMRLIERYGCYNCHKFKGHFEELATEKKSGPPLDRMASKLEKDWVAKWLWDPKSFRPSTLMPQFWQTHNNSDPDSLARGKVEVESIAHYLFSRSKEYKALELASAVNGRIEKGKEIVGSVGCLGCHASEDFPRENPASIHDLGWKDPRVPLPGPELNQMGSKVTEDWLYSWLKNPRHYWEQTSMPSMKLSDQEAMDVTAYLLSKRNTEFEELEVPKGDAQVRTAVLMEVLTKKMSPKEAELKLASMSLDEQKNFLGEKFVSHYGCYACHAIEGFEKFPNIGAELTEEGSKDVSKFDYGNVHIPHLAAADWIYTKVRTPRIFDVGKLRSFDAKSRMPHFGFTHEQAEAIASIVVGHEIQKVDASAKFPVTGRMEDIIAGHRVINRYNCVGCHALENKAGHILSHYSEDPSMGPPNLNTQGRKTQSDWLHSYLLNTNVMIRPWLDIRMPTFGMSSEEATQLTKYFSAYDKASYPFEKKTNGLLTASEVKEVESMVEELACYSCHGVVPPGGDVSAAAPHFKNIKTRLRPEWVADWLKDPNSIMPGTRMPQLWPPEDFEDPNSAHMALPGYFGEDAQVQIEKMRDYLFQYNDSSVSSSDSED